MKISVITAVYNCEATVGDAIASVAEQSHQNIEHVIVDGDSQDGTLRAIHRAGHDRMVIVSEPDNGIYDALNKGIALATGDVVGVVHGDDYLAHREVLSRVAQTFSDADVESVYGDLDYVAKHDPEHVIRRWRSKHFEPRFLRRGWMPPHPTFYVRREVFSRVGVYDSSLKISADYDFLLRYFSQLQGQSTYIPDVLIKMRAGGVSNRNIRNILLKTREDYAALRRNKIGGAGSLAYKNLSKIGQFFTKNGTAAD